MTDTIICPSCGAEIAVSETLSAQIREHVRREFDQEAKRKDIDLERRREEIRLQERLLEESRQSMEQEISARVTQEQTRMAEEARVKASETVALEMSDLEGQLSEAKGKLVEARKAELQLRKERRELEERQSELELTVARTVDEERAKIRDEAKREAEEQNRLKDAEKEKLIEDLRDQIDDLKRVAEKGSPQVRGEVMEIELEDLLRELFPNDDIDSVPVGAHGGDILQRVHDVTGQDCGLILWEAKRTKNWSDTWLPKLRNDQRAAKAHVAVLTSEELPKGLVTFGYIDGVWVTNRLCLVGLAAALRQGLIEAARTRRALEGRHDKMEFLYAYLAGPEFRQRIEGIAEAFVALQDDLDSEKRSMHRLWAKREKQIQRATLNTAGLYGDLCGILGPSMPQIADLGLPTIAADSESLPLESVAAEIPDSPF
jgi:hypothetical protein